MYWFILSLLLEFAEEWLQGQTMLPVTRVAPHKCVQWRKASGEIYLQSNTMEQQKSGEPYKGMCLS